MKKEIFREYDIRGIYNEDLTDNDAYIIGQSYGSYIQKKFNKSTCVVGADNRLSSPSLQDNLIKGLVDSGTDVVNLGTCTTPMFAYATLKTNLTFGLMVTASHNPKEYNGFKFTFDNLGMARGKQIYDFRDFTLKNEFLKGNGKVTNFDILPYYTSLIKDNIKMGNRPLKVVVDPGNGTTSLFVKNIYSLFSNLELVMINDTSDATFPNHHPDPNIAENLVMLQEKVKEVKADLGVAFDGDGDRLGVVNNLGEIVSTENLMILIIRNIINKVKNKTFLFDIKCSKALEDEIIKLNGNPLIYRTGASYTRAKVNSDNIPFGGEYSGHLFFTDRWPGIDSGIYNGLRVIEILSNEPNNLSDMLNDVKKYITTPSIYIKVAESDKFSIVNAVKVEYEKLNYKLTDIDGVKVFYDNGWVLLRASNTTPCLEYRIEADTKENQNAINNHFMSILQKHLMNKITS